MPAFTHCVVHCPHCHKDNDITADGIDGNKAISCSKCCQPLGLWKDIKAAKLHEQRPAR